MPSAFVLIDKPSGITSFKALNAIKKQFGTKRVGHAGTLDMSASGLIVAAAGKCTRLLPYIEAQEKVYTFDLHLGILTDTLEPTGNILKRDNNAARTAEELNAVLQTFAGETEQIPPAYSAIKIDGKRASDLALNGQNIELKPRKITIYELKLISCPMSHVPYPSYQLHCKCSKGTYIRSLARDIAQKLGTYGVAGNIRRLAIGNISVEQAKGELILPNELLNWETVNVGEEDARKILNGVPVASGKWLVASGNLVFISHNGQVIAAAELQNGYFVPRFLL
ncbi:tRNA pseudouridine synthase B [Fibrobacteria bacterium R8-3-H12]